MTKNWSMAALAACAGLWLALPAAANSLRFLGGNVAIPPGTTLDAGRVMIQVDPHVPADVGAGDFTIEFWMKANASDNAPAPGETCDAGSDSESWINGNIILDRAIFNHDLNGDYGLSLFRNGANSARLSYGSFRGAGTPSGFGLCGTRNVADGQWHHVAITRQAGNGQVRIFVDGQIDAQGTGPTGDISYRNGQASNPDPGIPFNVDNYLGIGGEKFDADPARYPSYNGFFDELRLSTVIRYPAAFTRPTAAFTPDANTAALYHFDAASSGNCSQGTPIADSATGGQSSGVCWFGGNPAGPLWSADTPFAATPGTLQFSGASFNAAEGTGTPTVTMGVTREGGSVGAVGVTYATADGTAFAPGDYGSASAQLSWADGDGAAKTFTVPIVDDAVVETAESFTVGLSAPTGGATLGSQTSATVTIADNDSPGTLQLTAAALPTSETAGVRVVTVTRTNGSAGAVTVNYATSDGPVGPTGAVAPDDYATTNGTLSWASGDAASKSFNIAIVDDAVVDPAETFSVALSAPSGGAALGTPAAATVTIADNDSPGLLAFETTGFTVAEAAGTATITVTRTNGTIGAISVNYVSNNGVAMAPADYGAVTGTLTWANGEGGPKTFTISIVNDTAVEGNEPLSLALSGASGGATISPPGAATLTIIDDDVAQPGTLQFTQATANVAENAGTLVFTVTRVNGTDGTAQATVVSTNGSATAGNDFQLLSQALSWAAGESVSKTVTLTLSNDAADEPAETLVVSLTGVTGATVGMPNAVTVTIDDDDPPISQGGNDNGGGGAADFYFFLLGGLALFRRRRGQGILRAPL